MGLGLGRLKELLIREGLMKAREGLEQTVVRGTRRLPERRLFELQEHQIAEIALAGKPNAHPMIIVGRQNAVWARIARGMRFDYRTVQPVDGKPSPPYFSAIPLPDDERAAGYIIISGR